MAPSGKDQFEEDYSDLEDGYYTITCYSGDDSGPFENFEEAVADTEWYLSVQGGNAESQDIILIQNGRAIRVWEENTQDDAGYTEIFPD